MIHRARARKTNLSEVPGVAESWRDPESASECRIANSESACAVFTRDNPHTRLVLCNEEPRQDLKGHGDTYNIYYYFYLASSIYVNISDVRS